MSNFIMTPSNCFVKFLTASLLALLFLEYDESVLANGAAVPSSELRTMLSSPNVTDWGEWGDWEYCPENTYVIGMRLKTEPTQGPADDTALNGISFMCGVIGEPQMTLHSPSRKIQSLVGKWGTWGVSYECPGSYAVGFQLRSESDQKGQDDTAANNLRIFCSPASSEMSPGVHYLEGSGLSWGTWTTAQFCPFGWAMCAIKTQVERAKGHSVDDTALNNLEIQCCSLPE